MMVPMLFAVASLCSSGEQVVFSCTTTTKKLVSMCATNGDLQYRFGAAGKTPELIYPATREPANNVFLSGTMMFSGGGGAYLKFTNGGYTYAVFTGIGKGWEKEGVVVQKGGKQVAYLQCKGPWTSLIGPDFFDKAAIPKDPNESDFEIP